MIIRRARAGDKEPEIVCEVDRPTLTPRRYEMLDDRGATRFTLELSKYTAVGENNIVWPRHIVARGPSGTIVVELREVEVNAELAPEAFIPPRRAERLP